MKAPIIPQVKQGTNQSNIFNRTGLGFFKQPNGNNLGFSTKRTVYCADLFMTAVINNAMSTDSINFFLSNYSIYSL